MAAVATEGQVVSQPMTKEELVEKSWEFLPVITDKVATLKAEVQKQILQFGTVMRDSGMVYIHVVDRARAVNNKGQALIKSQQKQAEQSSASTGKK